MKEIRIYRGKEFEAQVRKGIEDNDIFIDEYIKALRLMEEILESSKASIMEMNKTTNEFTTNNHREYNNNIIAFCGERGDGKSSAMLTFIHAIENNRTYENKVFNPGKIIKETNFVDKIYVDSSALDKLHNVLDIVVANMFRHFKEEYKKYSHINNAIEQREKIVDIFQKVYRALSLKKDSSLILKGEFDDEGNISKLSQLSETMRLKEYMSELIRAYFEIMNTLKHNTNNINNNAIIISIDDFDLNNSSAYSMAEEIRKYLIIPGVVIIMAVRIKQLAYGIEEYNLLNLNELYSKMNQAFIRHEIQEMAERYVSKFIPLPHRINLPKIQDYHDVILAYYDGINDANPRRLDNQSVVNFVLGKIFDKTGMIFRPNSQGGSLILPDNIRGMVSLIVLLEKMKEPKDNEKIIHNNLVQLLNYYYREWIDTMPKTNRKEFLICNELKKLIDFDVDLNLHIGISRLLDAINEIYYDNNPIGEVKVSPQFADDSDKGINTLCCVANMIRYISSVHYKLEVRRYLAAFSFLYTIKLNLIMTNKLLEDDGEVTKFVNYKIWGYDFCGVIPNVGNSSDGVSRTRFTLSSLRIYNVIAKSLGLDSEKYTNTINQTFFAHKIAPKTAARNKYIVAWILFGMFCNNYDEKSEHKHKRYKMLPADNYIYGNYVVNSREQVSIENFIVRLCMMRSLYEQLNLDILGVEIKQFNSVVKDLKSYNPQLMIVSKNIVANMDVIQDILIYCKKNNDYKRGTQNELERSEKLIEKFFCNLGTYFNEIKCIELIDIKKIFMFRYGKKKTEVINLAELYARLIQEKIIEDEEINNTSVTSKNKEKMMQEFTSLLDVSDDEQLNSDGYKQFPKYIRETDLSKVQQMLLNMAKNIGIYIRLSGDRGYLSDDFKNKLCNLYRNILNLLEQNNDLKATDDIRREYKELAEKFIPNELKNKISELQNEEK